MYEHGEDQYGEVVEWEVKLYNKVLQHYLQEEMLAESENRKDDEWHRVGITY